MITRSKKGFNITHYEIHINGIKKGVLLGRTKAMQYASRFQRDLFNNKPNKIYIINTETGEQKRIQ